jgi:hypothetical protein
MRGQPLPNARPAIPPQSHTTPASNRTLAINAIKTPSLMLARD